MLQSFIRLFRSPCTIIEPFGGTILYFRFSRSERPGIIYVSNVAFGQAETILVRKPHRSKAAG